MKKTKIEYSSYHDESGNRHMICQNSVPDGKYWKGQQCSHYTIVDEKASSVLCWRCTYLLDPFENSVKIQAPKSDKPRGWAFMKVYVHKDGTVYHKGVEQPKLKGTLPVTVIKPKTPKKRLSKKEKQQLKSQLLKEFNAFKKQLVKTKAVTKRKSIQSKMRKLERKINKL